MGTMLLANKRDKPSNVFSCDRYCVSAAFAMMSIFAETLSICAAARTVRFCVFAADDFRDLVLVDTLGA